MAQRSAKRELDQVLEHHGYRSSRSTPKGRPAKGPARSSSSPRASTAPPTPLDPVDVVVTAAKDMGDHGRFGFDKVYVAAIWDKVGGRLGVDLPTFKRWLIEQNRQGRLLLARADLIGAMDRQLVSRSEINDRGATFHFIIDRNAVLPY